MPTIQSLLSAPVVDLYRQDYTVVVAGDGLDYVTFVFALSVQDKKLERSLQKVVGKGFDLK